MTINQIFLWLNSWKKLFHFFVLRTTAIKNANEIFKEVAEFKKFPSLERYVGRRLFISTSRYAQMKMIKERTEATTKGENMSWRATNLLDYVIMASY